MKMLSSFPWEWSTGFQCLRQKPTLAFYLENEPLACHTESFQTPPPLPPWTRRRLGRLKRPKGYASRAYSIIRLVWDFWQNRHKTTGPGPVAHSFDETGRVRSSRGRESVNGGELKNVERERERGDWGEHVGSRYYYGERDDFSFSSERCIAETICPFPGKPIYSFRIHRRRRLQCNFLSAHIYGKMISCN